MNTLQPLIKRLSEFGSRSKVASGDIISELKKLLVGIYAEFVSVEPIFDKVEYPEEPDFSYQEIRQKLKSNFPQFEAYSEILDITKLAPDVEIGMGDPLDDLTDIIIDMSAIQWRFEHTSETDALWHFDFLMRTHSEQHIVDLLKYLKERFG